MLRSYIKSLHETLTRKTPLSEDYIPLLNAIMYLEPLAKDWEINGKLLESIPPMFVEEDDGHAYIRFTESPLEPLLDEEIYRWLKVLFSTDPQDTNFKKYVDAIHALVSYYIDILVDYKAGV